MGKTHMVEFAFGGTGHNGHWGAPYNPWDAAAHRSVGGSSSGAGVSLLEGSALLALGSDTAGSVRIPASMTGTVGLKVTLGRWSTEGVVPLSFTFDTPGLLARSVSDRLRLCRARSCWHRSSWLHRRRIRSCWGSSGRR
jgi:aspartyl-tRNA(Asn)/glutamyl-tRNA(Gln) amidotransferase subunit A